MKTKTKTEVKESHPSTSNELSDSELQGVVGGVRDLKPKKTTSGGKTTTLNQQNELDVPRSFGPI